MKVEVLAPGKALAATGPGSETKDGKRLTTNSVSCVIHLSQNGQAIAVLPGDIDDVGLTDLVRRNSKSGRVLDAPLLVYPHHGGLSGSGDPTDFAKKICDVFNPDTVIFSTGRGKHGTPRPKVVEAIRRSVRDLRIACTQLSEHCSDDLPDGEPDHLLPLYADGRQNRSYCAGTMLIDLDSVDTLLPLRDDHQAFVTTIAFEALCQKTLND